MRPIIPRQQPEDNNVFNETLVGLLNDR